MSRTDEDRILHGLHFFRESIDEQFTVTGEQILWLAAHSYSEGGAWAKDGEPQSFDMSVVPADLQRKLLLSKCELPLRYLSFRRLIKYAAAGEDLVQIAVTFAGADRAQRLHSRLGRLEIWYQEHRDGFLGLVTTVAVSFITAVAAVAVAEHLRASPGEAPRIIYEVDPKAQP
jgi:hypothetical protein